MVPQCDSPKLALPPYLVNDLMKPYWLDIEMPQPAVDPIGNVPSTRIRSYASQVILRWMSDMQVVSSREAGIQKREIIQYIK